MPKQILHSRAEAAPPNLLRPNRSTRLLGTVVLAAATALAYWGAVRGGFIFDDDLYLTENPLIAAPNGLGINWFTFKSVDYYPLSNSTLWLEWRLWGKVATGYHVTNLILHLISACMIWTILRKLAIPGAFLAAILFAVHPVNVESVAWIAQRKDVLATVFFLLSILWYLLADLPPDTTGNSRRWGLWYGLSLLAFVLAMLSKGSVAILPVVLLLIVWWRRDRITGWDVLRTAPFWFVAAVLTALNIWSQARLSSVPYRTAGLAERAAGAGAAIWFYLSKALAPIHLALVYPQWHVWTRNLLWWLPAISAALVTILLWRSRRLSSIRPLLFAWAFYCIALVPVMGFTDVGFMQYSLVADHYQHLAIIAVVALVAAGWDQWHARSRGVARSVTTVLAVVLVVGLMLLTAQQSWLFGNALALYQDAVAKNPDCWMTRNNLGITLDSMGREPEAIHQLERALQLKPDSGSTHYNLGNALFKAKRLQAAIEHFTAAVTLRPDFADAHTSLSNALLEAGRTAEAVAEGELAIQLNPDSVDAHYDLARAFKRAGELPQAIQEYQRALALKPNYPEALNNLGVALKQSGRLLEAVDRYQQAIKLKPDYTSALVNLATAYAQLNRSEDAIATATTALELAHSQGQAEIIQQIESWLTEYRSEQAKVQASARPPSQNVPETP